MKRERISNSRSRRSPAGGAWGSRRRERMHITFQRRRETMCCADHWKKTYMTSSSSKILSAANLCLTLYATTSRPSTGSPVLPESPKSPLEDHWKTCLEKFGPKFVIYCAFSSHMILQKAHFWSFCSYSR
ncbi:UDP-Glycosyltransferase superfamily protein [Striga asiatica]|uniref:UDP-Glycosyltransferase superfamily protein n=1 Tax=Striga asiatica TaxID=4170 RepID=A0A5A7PV18_STRAF|nr:UDP-Glycosyltransferase superfamily protein [Striga asiatica]